jgi:hypothetical protein
VKLAVHCDDTAIPIRALAKTATKRAVRIVKARFHERAQVGRRKGEGVRTGRTNSLQGADKKLETRDSRADTTTDQRTWEKETTKTILGPAHAARERGTKETKRAENAS